MPGVFGPIPSATLDKDLIFFEPCVRCISYTLTPALSIRNFRIFHFLLRLFPRSSSASVVTVRFHFLTSSFCSSHFASFLPKRCNALHFESAPNLLTAFAALFFRLFLTYFDRFRLCFILALRSSEQIPSCKHVFPSPPLHLFAGFHPKSGIKKEDVKTC